MRSTAARILGGYGAEAAESIPALVVALTDSDDFVRSYAEYSLLQIIWEAGSGERMAIPGLVGALKNSNAEIRLSAARVLGYFASSSKDAVPHLLECFKSSDKSLRWEGALALAGIHQDHEAVVRVLLEILKGETGDNRTRAILALGRMGPKANAAVPELKKVLAGKETYDRLAAAQAVWKINKDSAMLQLLIQSLKGKDTTLRGEAAQMLTAFGPAAKEAIPSLLELLKDKTVGCRYDAAISLWEICEHDAAIPALVNITGDSMGWYRWQSVKKVGQIGPKAKAAVASLLGALNDEDLRVQRAAAQALKAIDPDAVKKAGLSIRK